MSRAYILPALIGAALVSSACDTDTFAPESVDPAFAVASAASSAGEILTFGDPPVPVEGSTTVTRSGNGVTMSVHTSDLVAGNAYTVWAVIFNEPAGCSEECGEDDLFNPDAVVDIVYVAGHVVRGKGGSTFSGRRAAGDNSGSLFAALGAPAPGLIDGYAAEIHLVVRDHGAAIPGGIPAQIMTFEGGCTADSSFGLGDGPNTCADVQFSIHLP